MFFAAMLWEGLLYEPASACCLPGEWMRCMAWRNLLICPVGRDAARRAPGTYTRSGRTLAPIA